MLLDKGNRVRGGAFTEFLFPAHNGRVHAKITPVHFGQGGLSPSTPLSILGRGSAESIRIYIIILIHICPNQRISDTAG